MGKQLTEMLKGTLEGVVLAKLSGRAAYGYEITAWLREQGFSDIAEGTVYALLIRVEQRGRVAWRRSRPRRGRREGLLPQRPGTEVPGRVWGTWSFLTERLDKLHEGGG